MSYASHKIYYISMTYDENGNTITRYGVYDLLKGEDAEFIAGEEILSPCAIAADPNSGIVYVSSYGQGAMGGIDYSGAGYIVAYSSDGTMLKKYDAGVAPSVFVFQTSCSVLSLQLSMTENRCYYKDPPKANQKNQSLYCSA